MNKLIIKIGLIVLFLLALFEMPYWYYQVVRIFGSIGLGYLAWCDYKSEIQFTPIIFGIGAVLFNPLIKIAFGRTAWHAVDVLFAVILLISIFLPKAKSESVKLNSRE